MLNVSAATSILQKTYNDGAWKQKLLFTGVDVKSLPTYARRANKSVFLPREYIWGELAKHESDTNVKLKNCWKI